MGRRPAHHRECDHRRTARVEGNLDQCPGILFPAGVDELLGPARSLGAATVRVSRGDARVSRCRGAAALAGVVTIAYSRGLARRRLMGAAPGAGRVRGVDLRTEEHPVGGVLSRGHFVLVALAGDSTPGGCVASRLCRGARLCRARHPEQTLDRYAAHRARSLRVVDVSPYLLERYVAPVALLRAVGAGGGLDDLGTEVQFGGNR